MERSQERASQTEATPHNKSRDEQSNRRRDNNNNQRPKDQDLGCAAVEPKQKYKCTCPVCGHARKHACKYKRDQDLSSVVVETRKKGTVHLQSADRHTNTKLFLHLSEAGGVKQASGRELHETEQK